MGCCNSKSVEKEGKIKDNAQHTIEEQSNSRQETDQRGKKTSKSIKPNLSQSKRIEKAARREIEKERGRKSRLEDGHGRDGVCVCAF